MFYSERKNSLLTEKSTLEALYAFKSFPVFIGCVDTPKEEDVRAEMAFDICTKTGFIQLRNLLPLDVIYSKYHSEALGGVWQTHHEQLAKFILKYSPKKVLEIGGSSGVLAKLVFAKDESLNWTIIEPNPTEKMPDERIKLIIGYFNEQFNPKEVFDTIVHSHLLEHLYDPKGALKHMQKILEAGGKQIFSIPNLQKWLANKFPNTLNFEHTIFLTETFTDYLLSVYGFKILEKQHFQDHSIFYAAEKIETLAVLPLPNCYAENKQLYMDFVSHHQEEAVSLNKKIEQAKGSVYLFGAHIFSQALLQFGLDESKIFGILDNSKIKQGKRLYGSDLKVLDPGTVKGQENVSVILRAGVYNQEITKQLIELNPQINFF